MQLKTDLLTTKKAALVLRALNHKLRQRMLQHLHEHPGINVTQLYVRLRLEQSVASQHLAILRKQDLVTCSRSGKEIMYRVNYERLQKVEQLAGEMIGKAVSVPVFSEEEERA